MQIVPENMLAFPAQEQRAFSCPYLAFSGTWTVPKNQCLSLYTACLPETSPEKAVSFTTTFLQHYYFWRCFQRQIHGKQQLFQSQNQAP